MIIGKIENLNPMIIKQDIRPNKMIWVTFRKEGIHKYPAALTDPSLATGDEYDVSFLGYPHRHIFHFKVWIGVTHDDRDIEFIQFKRWLENLYKDATLSLDYKSCEMMSGDLYDVISKKYPNREVWIEVSEDGENGSFIKY
jgi:frataxin-like iron-binding protein CyaY